MSAFALSFPRLINAVEISKAGVARCTPLCSCKVSLTRCHMGENGFSSRLFVVKIRLDLVPEVLTFLSLILCISDTKWQRTKAIDPRHLDDFKALFAMTHQLCSVKDRKLKALLDTPSTIFGAAFNNGLYIRLEYWDLYDIIQKRLTSNSSIRRILVVGSLGIEKSVFGVFLLLLLLMKKKHVAYRPLAHPQVHYFNWRLRGVGYATCQN